MHRQLRAALDNTDDAIHVRQVEFGIDALAVNIHRHLRQEHRYQGAKHCQRYRCQDDERITQAFVLGGQYQENNNDRKAEGQGQY